MIRPPKRAVTRFFIPLIDVMILLFCIFLLMPYVDKSASDRLAHGQAETLKKRVEELERTVAELERSRGSPEAVKQLEEELASERSKRVADRVIIQDLYFDRDNMRLYRMEETPGGKRYRRDVTKAEEAQELAIADRGKDTTRDLVYIVLYPPGKPPSREWAERFALWFGRLARLEWRELAAGGGGGS